MTEHRGKGLSEHTLDLFEQIPYPIIIHLNGTIIEANSEALSLSSVPVKQAFIGRNILEFLDKTSLEKAVTYMRTHEVYGAENFRLLNDKKEVREVEIKKGYFDERNVRFTFLILKDVTDQHRDIQRAARIQKASLTLPETLGGLEVIDGYHPKDTVSGDFYHMTWVDSHRIVGIVGDVKGKGISAALSTSALKILFFDLCDGFKDIQNLVNRLNKGVARLLGEEFVAATIFMIDLREDSIWVSTAGIDEFYVTEGDRLALQVMKGAFLGMFENSIFQIKKFPFKTGDQLYIFSDGLNSMTESFWQQRLLEEEDFKKRCDIFYKKCLESGAEDDRTWVAIQRVHEEEVYLNGNGI